MEAAILANPLSIHWIVLRGGIPNSGTFANRSTCGRPRLGNDVRSGDAQYPLDIAKCFHRSGAVAMQPITPCNTYKVSIVQYNVNNP